MAPRTTSTTVFGPQPTRPKEERIARVYDDQIHPLVTGRLNQLVLRHAVCAGDAQVLEVGCRAGALTVELVRRTGAAGRIIAVDGSPALIELGRQRMAREHAADGGARRVFFRLQPDGAKLPFADGLYDLVVAQLPLDVQPDPTAAIAELARVCKPGGTVLVGAPLRGSWDEFLDLLDEVLVRRGRDDAQAALRKHRETQPDGEALASALEKLGLQNAEVDGERWELVFRSAREFLYAPVVEHGPLPRWKELVGKGSEMQETFIAAKETIETYFGSRPFAVSLIGACVKARKPGDSQPGDGPGVASGPSPQASPEKSGRGQPRQPRQHHQKPDGRQQHSAEAGGPRTQGGPSDAQHDQRDSGEDERDGSQHVVSVPKPRARV